MESLRPGDPARIGAYRLVARLGSGAMGRVFLGRGRTGDLVAVKVIHARFAGNQGHRERFAREVSAARRMTTAFTAPVVDHDAAAAEPWLATAYLPGLTLRAAVELHGPLPGPVVRTLATVLAAALREIHGAGVMHRDLKPANVLLTPDGPRVVDFGIARPVDADTITAPGALLGTPGYLPPEQVSGRQAGPAGDVFAYGAVLVFAATGSGPYGSGSAPVLLYRTRSEEPRLDALEALGDPELTAAIAGCLARDPRRRPTPEQLLERLGGEPPARTGTGWLPADVAAGISTSSGGPARLSTVTRRTVVAAGLGALAVSGLSASRPRVATGRAAAPAERRPLWTHLSAETADHLFYLCTVVGGVAYVSTTDGLEAVDAAQGRLLWSANRGLAVKSGVVVAGEHVLYADERRLRALRTTLGSPASDWPDPVVPDGGGPAAGSGRVYVCGWDGHVSAFEIESGKVAWRSRVPARTEPGPGPDAVLAGRVLYLATDGLHALDAASGSVRWRFAGADSPALPYDGVVYTAGDGHVHAVDPRKGTARWSTDVGARIGGGVMAADGLVFAGDDVGRLHALDAVTGRPRWRFEAGGALRGVPLVSAGTVYVGADAHRFYAVRVADGTVRWSCPVGRQIGVRAAVWRDSVLVCTDLTRMCAYGR